MRSAGVQNGPLGLGAGSWERDGAERSETSLFVTVLDGV